LILSKLSEGHSLSIDLHLDVKIFLSEILVESYELLGTVFKRFCVQKVKLLFGRNIKISLILYGKIFVLLCGLTLNTLHYDAVLYDTN